MSKTTTENIQVACAIIQRDDRFFIARRKPEKSQAGKWEFPGGKRKTDESIEECLEREFIEEFGVNIKIGRLCGSNIHHYENISIELIGLYCKMDAHTFNMTDHDQTAWVTKEELRSYDLAPADIPLIDFIK